MGCHHHVFVKAAGADALADDTMLELASAPLVVESEFEFFTRRALEEARLAQQATSPAAANAHRYLAAAYSAQLAKHIKVHGDLEELLDALP